MRKQLLGWSSLSVLVLGAAAAGCSSMATTSPGTDGASGSATGGAAAGGSVGAAGSTSSSAGTSATAGSSGYVGSSAGAAGSSGSSSVAGMGGAGGNGSGGSNAGGSAGSAAAGAGGSSGGSGGAGGAPSTSGLKVVAYLADYSGSYSSWATKINFAKMTHLNLAFATVKAGNTWGFDGQSDSDVKALVDKAHAAGVKVLASLGGGGGDGSIFNNWGNTDAMVGNLDPFLTRLNLDGADIDVENPGEVGNINSTSQTNYDKFVEAIVAKLHPEGKLVTAAVAPWVGGPRLSTISQYDFVNIMVYTSNLDDYTNGVNYFKALPKTKMTLGAGFYGANDGDTNEISYAQIMAADSSAYTKNQTQVDGETYYYTGETAMKAIAAMSKNYGGIMVWDLTEDVTGTHSLWTLVQNAM